MTMEIVIDNEQDEEFIVKCMSCDETMDTRVADFFIDSATGECYCIDCGTVCDDCNNLYRPNRDVDRFNSMCSECEDNWSYCDRCESPTHNDEMQSVDYGREIWCEDCTIDNATYCERHDTYETDACSDYASGLVHEYDYSPDIGWFYNGIEKSGHGYNYKQLSENTFFGVELEVECRYDLEDGATAVLEHFNKGIEPKDETVVYLKQDGSIDNGFEIVTQPMTFDFAMSLDWSILSRLKDMNYRSWNGGACGLHVHVSRTAFRDRQHLWKFTQLVNINSRKCESLAGRNSERWSKYDKKLSSKIALGKEFPERYSAVNLINARTIELRIFRGSLRPERVPMAIQFAESCVEYTKDLSINQVAKGGLDWQKYEAFVRSNAEKYKELITIIDERVK